MTPPDDEQETGGKDSAELIDPEGNRLTPTPLKIDLHNCHAVRREMAAVYRDMRFGRIETHEGTRLIYALDVIRKAIETEGLEARLTHMEQKLVSLDAQDQAL
jgi:hypothetical protein